jgi:hypothetical protein
MKDFRGNGSQVQQAASLDAVDERRVPNVESAQPVYTKLQSGILFIMHALPTVLFATFLVLWQVILMHFYFRIHGASLFGIMTGREPIPVLRYATDDKTLGPLVEIIAWAGTAVLVRRLTKLARDMRSGAVETQRDFLDAIADFAESVFVSFMLMALLSVPKITFGTGIDLSLKEASIDVVIALACILGWSVRETRLLVGQIFRLLFTGHGLPNGMSVGK